MPPAQRRLLLLIPALILPAFGAWLYFDLWSGTPHGHATYLATKAFTVVWPLIALRMAGDGWPEAAPRDPRHRRALPLGLAVGVAIAAALGLLLLTPFHDVLLRRVGAIVGKIDELGIRDPWRYVLFGAFLAIVHSGIEEWFWRFYAYGQLARLVPAAAAHAVAAVAFAAHHLIVLLQYLPPGWAWLCTVGVAVGGASWSLLYRRQGSIAGAWLSHAVVDAMILGVGWYLLQIAS